MTWSIAARFISIGEAEAAASALEAAGIEFLLGDENIIGIDWQMAQAVGGVKILVREEDLERASEILSVPAGDQVVEPIIETPETADPIVCPECGSPEFVAIPRFRIFLLLAAIFIGIGVAVNQQMFGLIALIAVAAGVLLMPTARCTRCLHRWSPEPREERIEAPPPDPHDMIEEPCPRCGSLEFYRINDRRLKALPLLFTPTIFAVIPFWLLSASHRCDNCGFTR
jgi:predicted RNA-binding Zn-ribbon protein involved in translation (DUF1610 family)